MANEKHIGADVKAKRVVNGMVCLELGVGLDSDMAQLSTEELLHLIHSLGRSAYMDISEQEIGFPYTFPLTFGY